ncbi:SulA-like leucine-rich domain-containing protein [uncultured Ferrimonas sp.]|uniref:SulA-like leucine-rich domain-containing protein n=1 Tax=uncultured Ferrimonas sp. TaxID=432640 RepID=UPI00260F29A7|nr:SulA-like leucine-rich domain-containing protein [uncultured Ferrimonas sp.]
MKTSANLQHRHPGIWQTSVAARPSVTQHRCQRGKGLLAVAPQLQQLTQQSGWILLINAPECDWGAFVRQSGIDSKRILRVRCADDIEAMMALEQALTGGTCAAVLAWLPQLDNRDQRRLELVQKRAHCPAFLFHSELRLANSLPNPIH